jgi:hypothetical protein
MMKDTHDFSVYFSHADAPSMARVDWKDIPEEVLAAVRAVWRQQYPALDAAALDELTENYAAGTMEDYLSALGQELSHLQLQLHEFPGDGDEHPLAVIAQEEADAFEHASKTANTPIRTKLHKQPRRALGAAAKRLKLGDRLPHEKIELYAGDLVGLGELALVEFHGRELPLWLNLHTWPPTQHPLSFFPALHAEGIPYFGVASVYSAGLYAVLAESGERRGDYTFSHHECSLQFSRTPLQVDSWESIALPTELDSSSQLYFADEDLLLACKNVLWIVRNAFNGRHVAERLFEAPEGDETCAGEPPYFVCTGARQHVVQLAGMFYIWTGTQLLPKPWPIHKLVDFFSAMPIADGFGYAVCPDLLVELDTQTGRERTRQLQHIHGRVVLHRLSEEWAVLLRRDEPNKASDLAQFWHVRTDRWLRVPYGSLGQSRIQELFAAPDGHLLAHSGGTLYRLPPLNALIEHLSARKAGSHVPHPWSEWSELPVVSPAEPKVSCASNLDAQTLPSLWRRIRSSLKGA